jgi:hypothetical protein
MKIYLMYFISIVSFCGYGQTTEQELLNVIKLGVITKNLPTEIINKMDTFHLPTTVAIECTTDNHLKQYEMTKVDSIEIHIWNVKNMFLYDIYWLTPSNIKVTSDRMTFDFLTHTWGRKLTKYYSGSITAKKVNGDWNIVNVKTEVVEYSYNLVKSGARK